MKYALGRYRQVVGRLVPNVGFVVIDLHAIGSTRKNMDSVIDAVNVWHRSLRDQSVKRAGRRASVLIPKLNGELARKVQGWAVRNLDVTSGAVEAEALADHS